MIGCSTDVGGLCHNDSRTTGGKNKNRNGHFDMMSVAQRILPMSP